MDVHLIEIYKSILGDDRKCIYISCPILTGDRHIAWLRGELPGTLDEAVQYPNKKFAKWVINNIRKDWPNEIFINPCELGTINGWDRTKYDMLWADVIEGFAREVWFLNGWRSSVGCGLEYKQAKRLGLPLKEIWIEHDNQICIKDFIL